MRTRASSASRSLLRFLTCGSVDDGKSTLIGRLLFDSRLIHDDQMEAVSRASRKHGTVAGGADLALLVDGLDAEREQGITIDVAYRYFTTPVRSFIVADTPGHEQFTRNMATGASTAEAAVILVDARKGLLPQTKRHSVICSLMGIPEVVLAVNKIDLVEDAETVFREIERGYRAFASRLGFRRIAAIPLSALHGDNVAVASDRTPWYAGPTLLAHLEGVTGDEARSDTPFRFPVQWVNRPDQTFRGLAGTVAAGVIRPGEEIAVAGSGATSRVSRIVTFDGDLAEANAGQAVTLVLEDEIDVVRGDMLAKPDAPPAVSDHLVAHVVWMHERPLLPGRTYLLQIGTRSLPARVTAIRHRIDIESLAQAPAQTLDLNEIALVSIASSGVAAFDRYSDNRRTGAFILIDRESNATVAAGMVERGAPATNITPHRHVIDMDRRAVALGQRPIVVWFTGLSGSGKSTIAGILERMLHEAGRHTMLLDGDNLRHGLNSDLGFEEADRVENIRRAGEVAKLMMDAGLIVLCSFISPFAAERMVLRELIGDDRFLEVFVDTPIEECIRRDPKGLYRKALAGQLRNFTGVDSPYERPVAPDVLIDGGAIAPDQAAVAVFDAIEMRMTRDSRRPDDIGA